MFNNFIVWLVTKVLTQLDIVELYIKQVFVENPKKSVRSLFDHGVFHLDAHGNTIPNLEQFCMDALLAKYTSSELGYLITLNVLAKCMDGPEEQNKEFFEKAKAIKINTHHMKLKNEMIHLVRTETNLWDESDIKFVADQLITNTISPEANAKFMKETI